jgi:hypothetical protein
MRKSVIFISLLSTTLAACSGDDTGTTTPPPDGGTMTPPPTTTLHIRMQTAAALVAFRDGADAPWQAADMVSPTSFEATVHGPYTVSVVCNYGSVIAPAGRHGSEWDTWQVSRMPEETTELQAPCDPPPEFVAGIPVSVVAPGSVTIGDIITSSDAPNWTAYLGLATGTSDLVAASASRLVVRRGIVIGINNLPTIDPINADQEGTLLADAAFTAPNATGQETVQASVSLGTANNAADAPVFLGPPGAAKLVPEAMLAANDRPSVTLVATNGTSLRSLQRAFHAGDPTAFTLPPPIANGQWSVAGDALTAQWDGLPPFDSVVEHVEAQSGDPYGLFAVYERELSAAYLAATGLTKISVDTDIPGYLPGWKADLRQSYARTLRATKATGGDTAVSAISEANVVESGVAPPPAPH